MVTIAAGKTYLTAGGYVVEIINDKLQSSERTSPGITTVNLNILETNKKYKSKGGWYYEPEGAIKGLTKEWNEKLKIVEEFPCSLPELSEEYEWADGFPQYREPKNGEYYVTNHFTSCYEQYDGKDKKPIIYSTDNFTPIGKRLIVQKKQISSLPIQDSLITKYDETEVSDFIASVSKQKDGVAMKFPTYYKHKYGYHGDSKYVKRINKDHYTITLKNGEEDKNEEYKWDKVCDKAVAEGTWIEVPESEILDFIASVTVTEANSTLIKKEEEEMKKETLVKVASGTARFAGGWGFRAANYWLFEPAANLGRPIVKGVRYAVFLGSLSAAVYGYNHPEVVKNAIKSCIPKITIEAPEVLKG